MLEGKMTMDGSKPPSHGLIASDRVEGTPIRRPGGERMGTVDRLMIDKITGQVAYAVVSFGGFLGFGEKHLPVEWRNLRYNTESGAYELAMSDEDLERAAASAAQSHFDWGWREPKAGVRDYQRVPPI